MQKWCTVLFYFLLMCPFGRPAFAQSVVTVLNNGDPKNRVDIAVLGDGYTSGEMGKYADDVRKAMDGIFGQEPFAEYKRYFNVHRINVVSSESGVDHPEMVPPVYKNTAFDASYNCDGIQRAICANNSKVIAAASNALLPAQRDVYLLIVNDSQYGGTGGTIAVVSTHPTVVELILHEEAHTLGLLGDEYGGPPPPYCDTSYEPPQPNITMQTQRNLVKWNTWIDEATAIPTILSYPSIPGLYQGAQYCDSGKYRPTSGSKMRILGGPYDAVNTEQLIKRIYNWVSPLDSSAPSAANLSIGRGRGQHFSVTTPLPLTHELDVNWFVNGQAKGSGLEFSVDSSALSIGTHIVEAVVEDNTELVRKDPALALQDTRNWNLKVTEPSGLNIPLAAGGAAAATTAGLNAVARAGYAALDINSGATPYGTAVFSFKQNGVVVAEAGVPSSLPTTSARIFIDYRSGVNALPGHSDAGHISINTGIAVVNRGSAAANITYVLRNIAGNDLSTGHGTIGAGAHIACFIDQLNQSAAPDFNFPAVFQSAIQYGSLEITSDQPVSLLALRGTTNQRNDFLITTTPVADLTKPPGREAVYFPHFVNGGGYTTTLVLMNTSGKTESGVLEVLDDRGAPLAVPMAGGSMDSTFRYSIPAGGTVHLQTDGSAPEPISGWVRVVPDNYLTTPVGAGVFSYNPGEVMVSESGIPAATATTHARIYVDLSGNHNTGLAVANVNDSGSGINITAYQKDGVTTAGTSRGSLSLTAHGHSAAFADQFIAGLPAGFTGVIDIQSSTPFAALTLRSLVNENNDFLMTAFPIADVAQPAPAPLLFPQIVDGGGYATQFLLISPAGASSTTLRFYDEGGIPLDLTADGR